MGFIDRTKMGFIDQCFQHSWFNPCGETVCLNFFNCSFIKLNSVFRGWIMCMKHLHSFPSILFCAKATTCTGDRQTTWKNATRHRNYIYLGINCESRQKWDQSMFRSYFILKLSGYTFWRINLKININRKYSLICCNIITDVCLNCKCVRSVHFVRFVSRARNIP